MNRDYTAMVASLRNAGVKVASAAAVPEKDPADKGAAPTPAIVDEAKTKATEPAGQQSNTNVTPPNPAPTPAVVVSVPEKVAAISTALAGLMKRATAPAAPAVPAVPAAKKDEPKKEDKKPEEPKAAAPEVPKDPKEKAAPDPKVEAPKDAPKAAAAEVVVPEFTPEFHAKIGAAMLEFKEGRDMAEKVLRMKHGAEMAQDIIKSAAAMEEHALALQQQELEGATAAEQLMSEMSAEDLKIASALADAHSYDLSKLATPEEQAAYKAAAAQAAEMVDAGAGEMGDTEAMPEGFDPESVTPEDIIQVLEYLLAQGKIAPEEAEKILMEMQAAEAGGGEAGAEADPMADLPPEEKEAAVKAAAAEKTFDQLVAEAIK